ARDRPGLGRGPVPGGHHRAVHDRRPRDRRAIRPDPGGNVTAMTDPMLHATGRTAARTGTRLPVATRRLAVPITDTSAEDRDPTVPAAPHEVVFGLRDVSVYYGGFRAVRDVNLEIARQEITALIGPSGCGKSTLLRTLNRTNDLIPAARVEGTV